MQTILRIKKGNCIQTIHGRSSLTIDVAHTSMYILGLGLDRKIINRQELKELVISCQHEALAVTEPQRYRKSECQYSTQMRETWHVCPFLGWDLRPVPRKTLKSKASNGAV